MKIIGSRLDFTRMAFKTTILSITAFALIFTLSGCALIGLEDDSDDECKKNKLDLIERDFIPTVKVMYSDFIPFSGKVTYSIHKVYCDGRRNGQFNESGTTDANGNWNIGYRYTYKFEHPDDVVIIQISVTGTDSDGLELTDVKTISFDYLEVKDQDLIYYKDDHVVLLTWSSTQ